MASSVVVKVKYGDTLRRFNAAVNENQQMELNIEGLRAKIRSLFNFTADADLKLTYIDEDMDMVALVDEEDLHDVVNQGLNPVRITVELNTGKAGSVTSSGTSTPVPSQGRNLNPNMNAGVADLLKSVPEPIREPLSKLSTELATKAACTSPVLADLIDSFTKVGQSFLNAHRAPQLTPADVAASKASGESQIKLWTGKDASASVDERMMQGADAQWDAIRCLLTSRCDKKMKKKEIKDQLKRKLRGSVNTPVGKHEEGSSSGKGTTDCAGSKFEKNPFAYKNVDKNMKSPYECPFSGIPIPPPVVPLPKGLRKSDSFGPTEGAIFHRGVRCDGCGVLPITGPRFKSKVKEDYDLCHICFEQMGKDADYIRIDFPAPYRHPWSLKCNPMMKSRPWVHPPPPPFGKHMKQFRPKFDSRFIVDVNVMDGTIMAPKTPFTKIWRMRNNGNLPWTHGTQLVWIGGDKFSPTDSVEIEVPVAGFYPENEVDVAVDFIAPELPGRYISYWKIASPSGQKFGQRIWVLIQVDASLSEVSSTGSNSLNLNLPPEGAGENNLPQSLDIGVEPLVNVEDEPSLVDPTTKIENPLSDAEQQNKLTTFPDDFLYDSIAHTASSSSAPLVPITPTISEPVPTTQDLPSTVPFLYPTIEPTLFNSVPGPQDLSSWVPFPYPTIEPALFNSVPAMSRPAVAPVEPATSQVEIPQQTESNNVVEEVLLKELEDMGFKQVDLNKEVLRKNDYNFEESLDELCNVSEWDLLLEELQGMGFVDKEVNKRVLAKNNGSLKHAVMDLITRENV